MIIQFIMQKNQYRRGVATEGVREIEFTIGEGGYVHELLVTTKNVSDDLVAKLIETLLMGSYSKIIYKGVRYFKNGNVNEVMELSARYQAS